MSGSSAASSSAPVGASSGQGGGSSQGFVAVNVPPSTVTSAGLSTVNLSAAASAIGNAAAGSAGTGGSVCVSGGLAGVTSGGVTFPGLVGSYGLDGNPPPASMTTASMWPAPTSFGLTPSPLMAPPQYSSRWYGMKMDDKAPVMQGSFDLYAKD
ncbi:hypothetical protein PR003_g30563 [Phytophthora rubi]|uniref:Uncharacterized protein n=1 Tax=Phytophthora rubi TaxID=129364 RepID=A0A6A4BI64_9STRA|nr:hypothetical protein PR002_g29123 [Phytophthora rubi]KAE8965124.1 hypothetical protein PR001_g28823 [Phytophthora rubi]KAE9271267.1 hypothetical protein PR003_g30563 [Phytophthora rubi]